MSENKSVYGKSYKKAKTKNGSDYQSFTLDRKELAAALASITGERVSFTVFTDERVSEQGRPFTSVSLSIRELQKPQFQQATKFVRKSTLNTVVE